MFIHESDGIVSSQVFFIVIIVSCIASRVLGAGAWSTMVGWDIRLDMDLTGIQRYTFFFNRIGVSIIDINLYYL